MTFGVFLWFFFLFFVVVLDLWISPGARQKRALIPALCEMLRAWQGSLCTAGQMGL